MFTSGETYKSVDEAIESLINMYYSYNFGYNFYASRFHWSDYVCDYLDHLDRFPDEPDFYVDYLKKFRSIKEDYVSYRYMYDHGDCEELADYEFLKKLVEACSEHVMTNDLPDGVEEWEWFKSLFDGAMKKLEDEELLCLKDLSDIYDEFESEYEYLKEPVGEEKEERYSVGDRGPAGGYVFYDKGNYSDGWRYLEAAPADIRVVGGVPTVDSTLSGYESAEECYQFGCYMASSDGDVLYVNGTTKYDESNCTLTSIGLGKANTEKLVLAMDIKAYYLNYDELAIGSCYAARLCLELEHNGYSDWFLPSKEELNEMNQILHGKRLGDFKDDCSYWSSSEYDGYASDAWNQHFSHGRECYSYPYNRNNDAYIRPCRAF